ncbi:hypothetical protein [Nocardia sp. NPDC052316]|uniref:hypothetical protein n=1 Tax=Nocardia sp. NPDC052316 TaxID=3364329 RepID=UPI0037CBE08F
MAMIGLPEGFLLESEWLLLGSAALLSVAVSILEPVRVERGEPSSRAVVIVRFDHGPAPKYRIANGYNLFRGI